MSVFRQPIFSITRCSSSLFVFLLRQGILGETMIPTVDAVGAPIMQGLDCIRGQEEDYAVSDPLYTAFSLNA